MGREEVFKTTRVIIIGLLLIALTMSVSAQTDLDRDNIIDEKDACLNTAIGDKLPNPSKFPAYIGCSCSQIQGMTQGKAACMDFYCVAGRPLEAQQREFSKVLETCEPDYCEGDVLYDFPESSYPLCISGFPQETSCKPTVIENAQGCINGTIGPKQIINIDPVNNTNEVDVDPIPQAPNYVKKSFDVLLEDDSLKEFLGEPNREEFQEKIVNTLSNVDIKKEFTSVQITVDGKKIEVPVVEITLMPNKDASLKNIVVFEHVVSEGITYETFVFDTAPSKYIDNIIIWELDSIPESGIKLRYKLNTRKDFHSEVLVVGDVRSSPQILKWWPILLIPIIGYLAYRYMLSKKE